MSADSFLSSVVEVAVAIAGFAGIVAAIRHGRVATWPHAEQVLLRMLLTASGMTVSFALLPAVLAEAGLPEVRIWRWGSASILVWQVGIAAYRSRQLRQIDAASRAPYYVYTWFLVIVATQAINVVLAGSWLYLLGVFGVLVYAFIWFLLLLFGTFETVEADD